MKKVGSNTAPASGAAENDEETLRLVPATKIGLLKRQMDGAETRMIRLQAELSETRAKIRRKYQDEVDDNNVVVGRLTFSPEHIYGLRLKRVQIEKDLAEVKGEFLKYRRAYRRAVSHNFQIERKSVKAIREENRIVRESRKLLKKTKAVLNEHGSNGGAAQYAMLQNLALADDVRAFRDGFDQVMRTFDPAHHTMISGVSQVKTEIIHSIMEEMAEEAEKATETLTGAVSGKEGNHE